MQIINRQELKTMNEEEHRDFVLINVLNPDIFRKDHIRTSINVPVDDDGFADKVADVVADKDREVVVYCASTECSASEHAAKQLDDAGFTHVYEYKGGTKDWKMAEHHEKEAQEMRH